MADCEDVRITSSASERAHVVFLTALRFVEDSSAGKLGLEGFSTTLIRCGPGEVLEPLCLALGRICACLDLRFLSAIEDFYAITYHEQRLRFVQPQL